MKTLTMKKLVVLALACGAGLCVGAEPSASFPESMENRLEEGILLQEGKGDASGAALVFKEVIEAAGVADEIGAEAQYRLGECYLEQGKKALATATFQALLERFPAESKWRTAAESRLPKAFVPTTTPWQDGERGVYGWSLPNGQLMGYSVSLMQKFDHEGRPAWRHTQRYLLNGNAATVVEFDAETFRTIRSGMVSDAVGNLDCVFGEDGLSAKVHYSSNDSTQEFTFDTAVIDNEQAYSLMRQLPATVGYAMEQTVVVGLTGMNVPVGFEIVGLEQLDTAAGVFECYKIELTLPGPSQAIYVSTDENRSLVRMEVGAMKSELVALDVARPGTEREYRNAKYGFIVQHDDGWVVVEDPQPRGETASQQYFLDQEARGGFMLYSDTNDKLKEEERADFGALAASIRKGHMSNASDVLDESYSRDWEVNGMPAKSYCVRGNFANGKPKAHHVTLVMGAQRHFIFQGFMPPENLAEMQPKLERLAAGLAE